MHQCWRVPHTCPRASAYYTPVVFKFVSTRFTRNTCDVMSTFLDQKLLIRVSVIFIIATVKIAFLRDFKARIFIYPSSGVHESKFSFFILHATSFGFDKINFNSDGLFFSLTDSTATSDIRAHSHSFFFPSKNNHMAFGEQFLKRAL